jgi:hypothetical protein
VSLCALHSHLQFSAELRKTEYKEYGKVFAQYGPFFRMYTMYCNGHEAAAMALNDLSTSSEAVAEFLRNAGKKELVGGGAATPANPAMQRRGGVSSSSGKSVDIQSLLIAPVQRVPRYMLLLRELLKHTPSTHQPAHSQLEAALEKIKATATHINDQIKKKEDMLRVWQIQQFFFPLSCRVIMKPTRLFIRQGVLVKIGKSSGTRKRYTVFLFSDMLVYASKMAVGKGYWVERPDKTLRAVQPLGVREINTGPERHGRSSSMSSDSGGGDTGAPGRRPSLMKSVGSIFSKGQSGGGTDPTGQNKDDGDVSSDEEGGHDGEASVQAGGAGVEGGLHFEVFGGKNEKKIVFEAETKKDRDEWAHDISIVGAYVRRVREQEITHKQSTKGSGGQAGSRTMRLGSSRPGWFGNKRKGKDGKDKGDETEGAGGASSAGSGRSQTPPASMKRCDTAPSSLVGNRERCQTAPTAPTGSLIDLDGWVDGTEVDDGGASKGVLAGGQPRGSDLISFGAGEDGAASEAASEAASAGEDEGTSFLPASPANDIYSTVQAPLSPPTSPTSGTIGETTTAVADMYASLPPGISDSRRLQRPLSPASNFREQQLRQLLGPPPPPTAAFCPSSPGKDDGSMFAHRRTQSSAQ